MHATMRMALGALVLTLLSACASRPQATNAPVYSPSRGGAANATVAYGVVRSIDPIGTAGEQPQGGGAVLGGIIGAVVGRQFGDSNSGKNVGTVAGAVSGALIGNEVEKNTRREQQALRVTVQLERGGVRSFDYRSLGDLRVGDRVRVEGNQLYRV
ncbi:MAG: glycine zipper 2TM domain-containing protein [Pseudomonadota bacterium]